MLLTGVQLERGINTPFEIRPLATELPLCQRYYETSYEAGTPVGTATTNAAPGWSYVSSNRPKHFIPFKVQKRAVPAPAMWNPVNPYSATLRNIDASTSGAYTIDGAGMNGFRVYSTATATLGQEVSGHFAANAEL